MYTVRILSNEDYDKLPYKKTKTSLGLADPETNMAYVRDTGYNDITKATIAHELDELMQKVSPHEEDGIRYKDMGSNMTSLLAGGGAGALSSMIPGIRNFSPLISAGVGAATADKGDRFQGALRGFTGGGVGSSLGEGVFEGFNAIRKPGGTFGKAAEAFMPGLETGFNKYVSRLPGFGGFGGTEGNIGAFTKMLQGGNSTGGVPQVMAKTGGGNVLSAFGGGSPLLSSNKAYDTPANVKTDFATAGPMSIFGGTDAIKKAVTEGTKAGMGGGEKNQQFKNALLGSGIGMLGELFAPKVETPDFSGIIQNLENKISQGGEPIARELGMNELTRGLTNDLQAPPETAFTLGDIYGDRELERTLKNFDNHWKSIRPGADYKGDSEYQAQRAQIIADAAALRRAERDQLGFEFEREQLTRRYNYMVQALQVNDAQMKQYIDLAQLSVDQLMIQYGVDQRVAEDFKKLFAGFAQLPQQDDLYNRGGLDGLFANIRGGQQ